MNEKENGNVPGDTPRDDSSVDAPVSDNTMRADEAVRVESSASADAGERLQKLIARAGIASRRAAEQLITEGRVFVNGCAVKELGAKANPQTDRIAVDGKPLFFSDKAPTVVLLHKPRGYVTTKSDPEKRAVVLDLLPKKFQHLHPVGRLDYDTAGVLLLTDDGDLTHLLTHPSHGIEKVYHARARGEIKPEELKKIESGVWISEGEGANERKVKTLPCRARVRAQTESNALIEIALREGRNRQVRKMLEAVGHPVSALRRIAFAGVELEGLPAGAHRVLLDGEVHELRKRATRQLEKAKRQRNKQNAAEEPFSDIQSQRKADARKADLRKSGERIKRAESKSAGPARANPKNSVSEKRSSAIQNQRTANSKAPALRTSTLGERIRREWK